MLVLPLLMVYNIPRSNTDILVNNHILIIDTYFICGSCTVKIAMSFQMCWKANMVHECPASKCYGSSWGWL